MRILRDFNNVSISKVSYTKSVQTDREIKIIDFTRPLKCNDGNYIMTISFKGFLIIKEVLYNFRFSFELLTDRNKDLQAISDDNLGEILKIVKNDFYSENSKIVLRLLKCIINLYESDLEMMSL